MTGDGKICSESHGTDCKSLMAPAFSTIVLGRPRLRDGHQQGVPLPVHMLQQPHSVLGGPSRQAWLPTVTGAERSLVWHTPLLAVQLSTFKVLERL